MPGAYALVRGGLTTSNLLEPHHNRDSKVCRVLSHEFGVVRLHRTFSIYIVTVETHCYRDRKVCRILSHEFGVVRHHRTFSIYMVAGETRCAGCLCTSSGWFKHVEPRRTLSNDIITDIVRCVEFCHMSSGWFDCTEPSLSTSLQGQQGMQGVVHKTGQATNFSLYALVRGG